MTAGKSVEPTVLFDLDGTLTDPFVGITSSIRHAMEKLGRVAPASEDLRWCIGPPLKGAFMRLLDTSDEQMADEAVRLYRERYRTVGKFENSVIEGIPEALDKLRGGGFQLFVATSKLASYAGDILDHFGLRQYFAALYGSQADGTHADKEDLIHNLLTVESIPSGRAVMIGDRSPDVVGAKANGLPAIGVLWGYGDREELVGAGAIRIAELPEEIPAMLRDIFIAA
ncbi:MAG TPA: HAD hydrolase-like protein [Rhizobiaceae bacterium]|nr:HAD hydrolase-like protein [Rhizobiaceae bacterium]